MNEISFSFSDTIAGYVTTVAEDRQSFGLRTSDGRAFHVKMTPATYAERVRNLGEPYADAMGSLGDVLLPGRYLFAYGVFYSQDEGHAFEAKHLVFPGGPREEYVFECPDWWVRQIRSLGDFYLKAQFEGGPVDYANYRTKINLNGTKTDDPRQETDTISRLVYGLASAYLLTGDDRYLEGAEKGTDYLRDHLRFVDEDQGIVYWFHGADVEPNGCLKRYAGSQFGDDYNALPAYEQIYALAGPIQTYRATGDPRILSDAEMTINLFDRFYLDREKGGYFSHLDPVALDPCAESLGQNRARKNWNSVGDHAPAYLINLWLATGEQKYADFLAYTFDTIERYFPDYQNSPFVNEKFFEDWSHDQQWGWQQNRAVVGHNLKIAWNLMRMYHLKPEERYVTLAKQIAEIMPAVGMDKQRGGWYDVVERTLAPGERQHRFVWHDRKAWWQQEQGILAYLILHGSLKNDEYLRYARESSAFYNAWFLDQDDGAVYFNVLGNGLPYLLGNERLKGSHSMSGYHSFELAYLASIYTNLLITKQPMDFHFKPKPNGFKDRVLRVQPDILPPGSVHITHVTIDGTAYGNFDADGLTVTLPDSSSDLRVKVTIAAK